MKKILKLIEKLLTVISKIPHDKILNMFCGYIISHIGNNLYCLICHASYRGAIVGVLLAFVIGVLKEIYDDCYRKDKQVELADIAYTTLGGVIGSIISLI